MLTLAKTLLEEPGFKRLISGIEAGGCPAVVNGLSEIHRAHIAAAIRTGTMRPIVVFCSAEDECERVAQDIGALTMEQPLTLSMREFIFHNTEGVSRQIEQRRLATLNALVENRAPIIVMSVSGALQRTLPPTLLKKVSMTLKAHEEYDINDVINKLIKCGYSRSEQVEGTGQFALRGGILDFFSPAHDEPVRCEFYGDVIDTMCFFDVLSQRRSGTLDRARITPVAEMLPSLYHGSGGDGMT